MWKGGEIRQKGKHEFITKGWWGGGITPTPPSNCYVKYVKLTLTSGGIPGSVNPSTTTDLSK